MAATKLARTTSSRFVSGTGVLINSLEDFENAGEEPKTLLRYVLKDPDDTAVFAIGKPLYQMTMVKSFVFDVVPDEPHMVVLVHCDTLKKIIAVPVFKNGNFTETENWLRTYADLAAVDHAVAGAGYVIASVPVEEDNLMAPSPRYLTSVIGIPEVADKLGVTVLPYEASGHTPAASAVISGTSLGFSGSQLTDWRWTGFVATRDKVNTDNITVFAGLEKLDVTRKGPGDLSGSANYVFTVSESLGTLISAASEVDIDIPFTPHQMASGDNDEGQTVFWCVGRADPEFINPSLTHNMLSVVATNALTLAGSIGIWSPADTTLSVWRRIYESPVGISSPPIHHLDDSAVGHTEVPRDLGIMFNPLWQRLVPFMIDNDSGQDPVTEVPRRANKPPA